MSSVEDLDPEIIIVEDPEIVIIEDLSSEDVENVTVEDLTIDDLDNVSVDPESETNKVSEQKISLLKAKHATMGLYIPPSLRSTQLNVHAKEFVMGSSGSKLKRNDDKLEITSKMNSKLSDRLNALNTSKSSSTVFDLTKSSFNQFKANDNVKTAKEPLSSKIKFGDSLLSNGANGIDRIKLQFSEPYSAKGDYKISERISPTKKSTGFNVQPSIGNLKRSKSLNAADALKLLSLESTYSNKSFTEYDLFPEKLHNLIQQAVDYPDRIKDKNKIVLGRTLVEHAVDDKKLASPAAKLSVIVMNKDKTGAFLDSLLNTAQMLYQTKNQNCLCNPRKLAAFLMFLQELYTEMERNKLQLKLLTESVTPPKSTFLLLIARCCNDILERDGIHSLTEIECVFQTLVTIGRDIEGEIPKMFGKLFDVIRRVLLKKKNEREIQKLLLQLIELRTAKWQLPISALNYYYPKVVSS